MDCLFCKIANKEMPTEIILENDKVVVFRDINPKTKIHLLVVPKKHISTINDLEEEDKDIISQVVFTAKEVAKKMGFSEKGYKLSFNVGEKGGQSIFHIHLHVLSEDGEEMKS